ncbi:MAG: DUF1643 domain-containing protein [Magnetococcales bacterium]|nr:DUF1643 domain-containing protein [Magnetococcales bacterium]
MVYKYKHRPNLSVKADFSPEGVPVFRYRLEITKKNNANKSSKTVCAIMQNPSYAREEYADRSVQVLERVVFEHGLKEFEGAVRLIVVNLFAYIKTNNFVGTDAEIGSKNNDVISKAFKESNIILIAWGKSNHFTKRKDYVTSLIKNMEDKTILETSCHPSRVKYDDFIQPFKFQ